MCGIAGIVSLDRPVDAAILTRMTNALVHRGPDDEGAWITPPTGGAPAVGLGFRRLSIIDLAGGHQPMSNEDGTLWVIFNGEIYNFKELRSDLEVRGHRFRTRSDTEVLVHLYQEYGSACVERLNGMFAFAIWDVLRQRLFVGRDRMGKKPLYYVDTGKTFLFASELKALMQHPECPRGLNPAALRRYLAYEYVPAPHCILAGVRKLPAAHVLTWEQGRIQVSRYWDLQFPEHRSRRPVAEYAEELRTRLGAAVERRLVSDVPLGVFLSGGIDSSSVVALMAERVDPAEIRTFSIGFEDPSFDESSWARTVANFYGTRHHEEVLKPQTLVDILPRVAAFLDEPFADASIIPTYLLSRFTRQHVTVALGGDGGDELLAGYPTFAADRAARFYRIPRLLHDRFVVPLAGRMPVSTDNFSFDFKVKRFLRGAPYDAGIRNQVWLGAFGPDEQGDLLRDHAVDDPYADVAAAERDCTSRDPLERLIYLYCRFYLQDDILTKVDRASMACSLEVRAPFLDHTLVEYIATIPPDLKLRGFNGKYILKRAMADRLPPGIARRSKKGFGIPVAKWFRGELRSLVHETLSPARLRQQGIFHPETVQRLLLEHDRGSHDHRKQLWTLFMFQLWSDTYAAAPQPIATA